MNDEQVLTLPCYRSEPALRLIVQERASRVFVGHRLG